MANFFLSWLGPALDRHNTLILVRCSLAAFLCGLTLAIDPVEVWTGQAAFLPIILVCIKPPSDPTVIVLFHTILTTLVCGLTWGWLTIALKLANLARDNGKDARVEQQLAGDASSPAEAAVIIELNALKGAFLQTGPTIIVAVFVFINTYCLFILRAYRSRLFFIPILALIPVAIFGTLGTLFPGFTLAVQTVSWIYYKPFGMYLIATIFSVFILPSSVKTFIFAKLSVQAQTHSKIFSTDLLKASTEEDMKKLVELMETARGQSSDVNDAIEVHRAGLTWEARYSRWNSEDANRLIFYMKVVKLRLVSTVTFVRHALKLNGAYHSVENRRSDEKTETVPFEGLHPEIRSVLVRLQTDSGNFPKALKTAWENVAEFLERHAVSRPFGHLWVQDDECISKMKINVAELKKEIGIFETTFSQPFKGSTPQSRPSTGTNGAPPSIAYLESQGSTHETVTEEEKPRVHEHFLEAGPFLLHEHYGFFGLLLARSIIDTVELIIEVESRPRPRLQLPSWKWRQAEKLFGLPGEAPGLQGEDDPDIVTGATASVLESATLQRRPRGWKKAVLNLGWLFGPQSFFAFKTAVVIIATCVPAWTTTNDSAYFYYKAKGIWAAVMAGLATSMFCGELIFGYIQRVIGACIGALVGCTMWYISAGNGNGNPYGLMAVIAVVAPFAFLHRIYLVKNFVANVTGTATGALVLGYSYIDTTHPSPFAPGKGIQVMWKRIVLVLIGITAGYIATAFPRPPTGREYIRRSYVATSRDLGSVTAALISLIRSGDTRDEHYDEIAHTLLAIHAKLRSTNIPLRLSKLEPSLTGSFSLERYTRLQKYQFEITDLLGQLLVASRQFDATWRTRWLDCPAMRSDALVAISSQFYIISTGLASQNSVPMFVPHFSEADIERNSLHAIDVLSGKNAVLSSQAAFMIANASLLSIHRVLNLAVTDVRELFGEGMRVV